MNNSNSYMNFSPYREGMYILLPLMFCQFVSIHTVIGFSPHIIFGLGIIYFYGSIIKSHILPLSLFILFLIASSFIDGAIKQAIQISIEMMYGYLIAHFFVYRYSKWQLLNFFKNLLVIWFVLVAIFLFDYYFFYSTLNQIFEIFTDWKAGGESTLFARISIIFGNPNWLSLFYLLIFSIYLHLGGKNIIIIAISITTVFMLQTKTAIVIAFFLPVLSYYNTTSNIKTLLFLVVFSASILLITIINWNKIYDFYISILELSSFINREALYLYIEPYIKLYPNGLIGEGSKELLRSVSNEDSMPSFFLILRLLGVPITIILLAYFLNPAKKINLVIFTLIFMSITQSFLSISGACSLAFFAAFLSYFVSINHNYKYDIYTR